MAIILLRRAVDGRVRRIASEWHAGQSSALYSFTSTGAVNRDLQTEISAEITHLSAGLADLATRGPVNPEMTANLDELEELYSYVIDAGYRGPVEGWSDIWDVDA